MRGGEAKFWGELRIPLKAMGDVDRIESHSTCIGRPDLNMCLDPGIVWDIELKYSDNGKIVIRPAQRMWFSKRARVRANAFVFTKASINGEFLYIINMRFPDTDRLDDWIDYSHHMWDREIIYTELEEILRAQK